MFRVDERVVPSVTSSQSLSQECIKSLDSVFDVLQEGSLVVRLAVQVDALTEHRVQSLQLLHTEALAFLHHQIQ